MYSITSKSLECRTEKYRSIIIRMLCKYQKYCFYIIDWLIINITQRIVNTHASVSQQHYTVVAARSGASLN